jgi:hypothetical protein
MVYIFALANSHGVFEQAYRRTLRGTNTFAVVHLSAVSQRWRRLSFEPRLGAHVDLVVGQSEDK